MIFKNKFSALGINKILFTLFTHVKISGASAIASVGCNGENMFLKLDE